MLFQTCVCIWKNGKETVECINRDLGEIPEGVEPSTQVTICLKFKLSYKMLTFLNVLLLRFLICVGTVFPCYLIISSQT